MANCTMKPFSEIESNDQVYSLLLLDMCPLGLTIKLNLKSKMSHWIRLIEAWNREVHLVSLLASFLRDDFIEKVKFESVQFFTHQSMMGNSQDPATAQHHLSKIKNRSISCLFYEPSLCCSRSNEFRNRATLC